MDTRKLERAVETGVVTVEEAVARLAAERDRLRKDMEHAYRRAATMAAVGDRQGSTDWTNEAVRVADRLWEVSAAHDRLTVELDVNV
jgi:hypothetical protein